MTENPRTFSKLHVRGWRQFSDVSLDLHPRLTVLTGANGAGKSTLLNFFNMHFGYNRPWLATPTMSKEGEYKYLVGLVHRLLGTNENPSDQRIAIGDIVYSDGEQTIIEANEQKAVQYHLHLPRQHEVSGLHIPSHRYSPSYQQVTSIPTTLISSERAYSSYFSENMNRYMGQYFQYSPLYRMKEAILSMAVFGAGNKYVTRNRDTHSTFVGFNETLRKILPATLGFKEIGIRSPDVVLVTASGDFLIDASSGGLMSLIDLAWQIYIYSRNKPSFVVTIDEPENHLHPSMQRSLMPNLLEAFPGVQFIIATHSPFMVTSLKTSNVYVLRYAYNSPRLSATPQSNRRVYSEVLDTINKAGDANEVLREVLGVPATVPEWVEDELADVVERFREQPLTPESLARLRKELSAFGYDHLFPEAISALVQKQ